MKHIISFILSLTFTVQLNAQVMSDFDVAAENFEYKIKDIGTFIHRFNNQVDRKGNPINKNADPADRSFQKKRMKELVTVFDYDYLKECTEDEQILIKQFVHEVVSNGVFLNFYDEDWFAEIKYKVRYSGNEEELIFVLYNYSTGQQASGWTLSSFYFKPADLKYFTEEPPIILPPNSDGTMFINLKQVLTDDKEIKSLLKQDDELAELLNLIQSGEITLEHITKIRYHFWQIEPYHLIVDYYNRNEANSGWLISAVFKE